MEASSVSYVRNDHLEYENATQKKEEAKLLCFIPISDESYVCVCNVCVYVNVWLDFKFNFIAWEAYECMSEVPAPKLTHKIDNLSHADSMYT